MRLLFSIVFLLASLLAIRAENVPTQSMLEKQLHKLDEVIANKAHYQQRKQVHLDSLYAQLQQMQGQERIDHMKNLYEEMASFSGRKCLDLLEEMDSLPAAKTDKNLQAWIKVSRANIEATMGLYHKAFEALNQINPNELDKENRIYFYHRAISVINWAYEFGRGRHLKDNNYQASQAYLDSLIVLEPQETSGGAISRASSLLEQHKYEESLKVCDEIENSVSGKDIIYLACIRAEDYDALEQTIPASYYFTIAAIDDIQSGVNEYMALPVLVERLFHLGYLEEAYRYLLCCMEDSNLYPSNYLSVESNTVFPVISRAYIELENRKVVIRRIVYIAVGIVLSLLAIMAVYLRGRHRTIRLLNQKNTELATALNRAEAADKLKTQLIQNVSHEVRTPLNIINGFAQVLTDPDMDLDADTKHDFGAQINEQTVQLTNMMNTIITLSNYDSNEVEYNWDNIDPMGLVTDCIERVSHSYQSQVELKTNNLLPKGFTLRTDFQQLSMVMDGLIGNALKFTESGTVTVEARLEDSGSFVQLIVEDTGKGIPQEESEAIFERFTKLDDFVPGAGLGLSLCRAIVTHLNGQIKLDTSYTAGARFVVTLPV